MFFYLFCRLRAPTRGLATWQASIFGLLKPRFLILVHAVRRSLAILCGCVSFVLFLSFSRSHRRVGHLAGLKLSTSGLSVSHFRARILYKSAHVSASFSFRYSFSCKDSLQKCPHRKNNVFKMCILVQGFSIKAFMSEIMPVLHVSIFCLSYKDSLQKVLTSDMLKIS